jgi:DHA2 family multidrug resistance protein
MKNHPHKWFIVAAVMLATIMEILDTTIVNVSLPHMMGSLGADRDEISWVLTSYIVAAGILMPLTGFLVARLGSKRLLLINIAGFLFASTLCGIATNLTEMVVFRLMQGVFGASLVPLSQFILRDSFPAEEQPKLMAIWATGIMAAPIMGPTIGGYITDILNWRWIFYINVPVCVIDFFLVMRFIKSSPVKRGSVDWWGMALMMISIGALQLFLDRGEVDDWFASTTIRWLCVIFVVTFIGFVRHCLKAPHPIINLRLFKDRQFAMGTLMVTLFSAAIFGCLPLLPEMLESLFGYTSDLAGLAMAARGITCGIMMGVSSQLVMRGVDARWLIVVGLCLCAYSTNLLSQMTLDTSMGFVVLSGLLQGFGIGCFFMPLNVIVYSTLPASATAEATGLFSFGRNIGNAIGISVLTTFLDRETQMHWNRLASHLQATKATVSHWLSVQHLSANNPQAVAKLASLVSTQANFMAYTHLFEMAACMLFSITIMVFLVSAPKSYSQPVEVH